MYGRESFFVLFFEIKARTVTAVEKGSSADIKDGSAGEKQKDKRENT